VCHFTFTLKKSTTAPPSSLALTGCRTLHHTMSRENIYKRLIMLTYHTPASRAKRYCKYQTMSGCKRNMSQFRMSALYLWHHIEDVLYKALFSCPSEQSERDEQSSLTMKKKCCTRPSGFETIQTKPPCTKSHISIWPRCRFLTYPLLHLPQTRRFKQMPGENIAHRTKSNHSPQDHDTYRQHRAHNTKESQW